MAQRLSVAILLAGACAAQAQPLADPTRPPSAVAPAHAPTSEGSRGGPRLQSVLISGTRKLAVIDGVTVPLGGKIDGATVVAIGETEVKLRQGDEVQTLKLYPGIERQLIEPAVDNKKESGQ